MEIVTMIRKGLSNLDNVSQGFYNSLLDTLDKLPEDKKKVSAERLECCVKCDFMLKNAIEAGIIESNIAPNRCSICKCFIDKKSFAYNDYCALSDVVLDEDEVAYNIDLETNQLFYITNNKDYVKKLLEITIGEEERVINNKKYRKLVIPRKFDRYDEKV